MNSITQPEVKLKSSDEVLGFIRDVEQAYLLDHSRTIGIERRSAERMNVTMPVRVTALDDNLEPLAYEYASVTRNISTSGVGLVTSNPIGRSHVRLTFEPFHGEPFTIVGRVIYCDEVGYYFQVGCEFISTE